MGTVRPLPSFLGTGTLRPAQGAWHDPEDGDSRSPPGWPLSGTRSRRRMLKAPTVRTGRGSDWLPWGLTSSDPPSQTVSALEKGGQSLAELVDVLGHPAVSDLSRARAHWQGPWDRPLRGAL